MADTYTLIGAILIVVPLIMLVLGLCKTAARADRQAVEDFESLRRKYNAQVRDDLNKVEEVRDEI